MFFGMGLTDILVIDDDISLQRLTKARLEGYDKAKTQSAMNGLDGLNMAIENKPDLIILDWMLPDIQGPEVLSQLKKHKATKDIPVLMLTGRNKIGEIDAVFELGANAYLTKPFALRKLSELVNKILNE
ncbi:MAG: response regulator [Cycloclasticus sp.]